MKKDKLIELIENVKTFEDAWDATNAIYEARKHDAEFIRSKDGWICRIVQVIVKQDGKDFTYHKKFILEEKEVDTLDKKADIPSAFKKAALKWVNGGRHADLLHPVPGGVVHAQAQAASACRPGGGHPALLYAAQRSGCRL